MSRMRAPTCQISTKEPYVGSWLPVAVKKDSAMMTAAFLMSFFAILACAMAGCMLAEVLSHNQGVNDKNCALWTCLAFVGMFIGSLPMGWLLYLKDYGNPGTLTYAIIIVVDVLVYLGTICCAALHERRFGRK